MIARHHRSARCAHPPAPNRRLHDITHLSVENQAASSDLPIADALARLVAEGLTRHEAIHSIGSVLSRYFFAALSPETPAPEFKEYYAEVRALTADSWRQSTGPDPEPHNPFLILDDDALIDLLFTEEDHLPWAVVDEILARGPRLAGTLIAIVVDPHSWEEPLPDWWAPIHATFILAANPDPACDAALLSAMHAAEAHHNDWIIEAMPAILGARGARLRPAFLEILRNGAEPTGVRGAALDGLVASTLIDPEGRDEIFTQVGDVFTAADESACLREHAGQVLLDFQVLAYERPLMDFAREAVEIANVQRSGIVPNLMAFDTNDVISAFRERPDHARYRRSWLDFYDDEAIAARQRRWEREAMAREREQPGPPKVGRNEPCPCGSGRKYKKCCLGAPA